MHPRVKQSPFANDYAIQDQVLGSGTFSVCYRAVHKASNKE